MLPRTVFFLLLCLMSSATARKPHAITFRSPSLYPESLSWDPREQHFLVGSLRRPTIKSVSDAGVVNTLLLPSLPPDSFILGLSLDRRLRRLLAVVHHPHAASLASFDLKSSSLLHLTPLTDPHNPIKQLTHDMAVDSDDKNADVTSESLIKQVTDVKKNTKSEGALADDVAGDSDADVTSEGLIRQVTDVKKKKKKMEFEAALANDVAVDFDGNAYVTSSLHDVIWKVNADGEASVLSRSVAFKGHAVDESLWFRGCGLNGVVYNSKGYLLVVQSNTGKLYRVDVDDGSARRVILNKDLVGGDGIAMRKDGVVVVVSQERLYFLKSDDSWGQGAVYDETALDVEKQASGVAVGDEDRVYVLYGYVNEGMDGNAEREEFSIVEVESEIEVKEDGVWVFVLVGLGLAYFLFWRFQMRHLVQNMNKKRA